MKIQLELAIKELYAYMDHPSCVMVADEIKKILPEGKMDKPAARKLATYLEPIYFACAKGKPGPSGMYKDKNGLSFSMMKDNPQKKTYYGFYVDELMGDIVDLEDREGFFGRPDCESTHFAFSRWFDTLEEREKAKLFMLEEIKKHRTAHKARPPETPFEKKMRLIREQLR